MYIYFGVGVLGTLNSNICKNQTWLKRKSNFKQVQLAIQLCVDNPAAIFDETEKSL